MYIKRKPLTPAESARRQMMLTAALAAVLPWPAKSARPLSQLAQDRALSVSKALLGRAKS